VLAGRAALGRRLGGWEHRRLAESLADYAPEGVRAYRQVLRATAASRGEPARSAISSRKIRSNSASSLKDTAQPSVVWNGLSRYRRLRREA